MMITGWIKKGVSGLCAGYLYQEFVSVLYDFLLYFVMIEVYYDYFRAWMTYLNSGFDSLRS